VARHPVTAFLAMIYPITVAFYSPPVRAQLDLDPFGFGLFVWDSLATICGVALPAFLVIGMAEGRDGVHDLARRALRWRVGPRWYLVALLALPLAVILCASVLFGAAPLQALLDKWQLLFTLVVPMLLVRLVFFNLPEEIGFMGFLQDRLQERHGPLKGSVLTTIPFALWHLPVWMIEFEFGLAELHLALAVTALFGVMHLFARVFLLWLYNNTRRSVLLVGLFHATFNTTVSPRGFGGEFIPMATAFWIAMGLLALAAVLVTVLTRGRLSYDRVRA
jgi:membrane protease YdiL (CAAX protease family)